MYPEPLVVDGTGYVDLGRHPSAAGIVESTLLQALLRGSSRLCLKSLTLANISGYPYGFYKSQEFVEVLSSIEHLHVSVHNGMYSIHGPRSEELSDWMWLVTVPANLLGPTQARLTSLTLMSDLPVGRSPRVDLSPLFFPMLRYLELGGFIFDHHRRTEDFIVRQGQTLTTLVLDSCSMYMSLGQDPIRPWRDVCDRFADTLEVLIDVQFHIREGWGLDNRKRTGEVRLFYVFSELEYGGRRGEDTLAYEVLDRPAIERLLAKAARRRLGGRASSAEYTASPQDSVVH